MARDFNGMNDRIGYGNAFDPAGSALTIAGWAYPDVNNTVDYLLTIHMGVAVTRAIGAEVYGSFDAGALKIFRAWTAGFPAWYERTRYGTGDLGTGSWQHFLVQSDSGGTSSGMECYVDAALPSSVANVGGGSGSQASASGAYSLGGVGYSRLYFFDGRLAELGVWARVLSADERNALAKGFSPLCFRRSLRFYVPLIGRKDIDRVGGQTPTYTGTSVVPHPRIFYPS